VQPERPCKVGRADGADLVIAEDGLLSRLHFQVECRESSCVVRDLNSTNGTFVNSRRIAEAELSDGDTLSAGRTTFTVRQAGAPDAADESAAAQPRVERRKSGVIATVLDMKAVNPDIKPDNPPEPLDE
jgi:pSer/pThr/pTyr-binding forkhead associated (FHA) protein